MMKTVVVALCMAVAACTVHDPNDDAGRMSREFATGEKLMNDCNVRQKNCSKYIDFKNAWEAEVNNFTTFENALTNHKARVAKGLAV